ncbi:MAG: sodium:proton antiporter, partial [Proteobacteria bacterium]
MKGFAGRPWWLLTLIIVLSAIAPSPLLAMEANPRIDLTQHPVGYLSLLIFFIAYGFV